MKNLNFVQDAIKNVAKDMDAVQFDALIRQYDLEFEYMETDDTDKNKDSYEVYLFDFDLHILFINGKFLP